MTAKRLLIVAYHYPPAKGSSGIQRTLKFSAYLRDFGWEPLILTVSPRAHVSVSNDQMGEIPAGMTVERAFGLDTARHLSLFGKYSLWMAQPDRWVSWWPAGVLRGLAMIRRHRPLAIMSTSPIATAHLIGLTLQRLSSLPWIADCRDSMTEPDYPTQRLTWKTNRWLEQKVVRHSTRTVFTTPSTLEMYAARYPEIPSTRWSVIENGFDEDNFSSAEAQIREPLARAEDEPITLVHSGVLYPHERDPVPFFRALAAMKRAGNAAARTLRVVLRATGHDGTFKQHLTELDIEDIVTLAPPIDYEAALREMIGADALLLFQGPSCNHQIPAKLYEYLRAGRPIFALTDGAGDTAKSLRAAETGHIADIGSEQDIAESLTRFLDELRQGRLHGAARDVAAKHSRRARTMQLATLLDAVVGAPTN